MDVGIVYAIISWLPPVTGMVIGLVYFFRTLDKRNTEGWTAVRYTYMATLYAVAGGLLAFAAVVGCVIIWTSFQ